MQIIGRIALPSNLNANAIFRSRSRQFDLVFEWSRTVAAALGSSPEICLNVYPEEQDPSAGSNEAVTDRKGSGRMPLDTIHEMSAADDRRSDIQLQEFGIKDPKILFRSVSEPTKISDLANGLHPISHLKASSVAAFPISKPFENHNIYSPTISTDEVEEECVVPEPPTPRSCTAFLQKNLRLINIPNDQVKEVTETYSMLVCVAQVTCLVDMKRRLGIMVPPIIDFVQGYRKSRLPEVLELLPMFNFSRTLFPSQVSSLGKKFMMSLYCLGTPIDVMLPCFQFHVDEYEENICDRCLLQGDPSRTVGSRRRTSALLADARDDRAHTAEFKRSLSRALMRIFNVEDNITQTPAQFCESHKDSEFTRVFRRFLYPTSSDLPPYLAVSFAGPAYPVIDTESIRLRYYKGQDGTSRFVVCRSTPFVLVNYCLI